VKSLPQIEMDETTHPSVTELLEAIESSLSSHISSLPPVYLRIDANAE
jgi:hypothetical protein